MKKTRAAGGGRKPLNPNEKTTKVAVTLLPSQVEAMEKLGNGNLSAGIRKAIDSMNIYYISAEMLGDEATDDDARRMVKLLEERGYTVEYGHPRSYQSDDDIATKDWEYGLDIISREKYAIE